MLQETLNGFFAAGSNQVRRRDLRLWVDPAADATLEALRDWEARGFITILADPRTSREQDACLRILRNITALPMPDDLKAGGDSL